MEIIRKDDHVMVGKDRLDYVTIDAYLDQIDYGQRAEEIMSKLSDKQIFELDKYINYPKTIILSQTLVEDIQMEMSSLVREAVEARRDAENDYEIKRLDGDNYLFFLSAGYEGSEAYPNNVTAFYKDSGYEIKLTDSQKDALMDVGCRISEEPVSEAEQRAAHADTLYKEIK